MSVAPENRIGNDCSTDPIREIGTFLDFVAGCAPSRGTIRREWDSTKNVNQNFEFPKMQFFHSVLLYPHVLSVFKEQYIIFI
jgi:hypothetical protein